MQIECDLSIVVVGPSLSQKSCSSQKFEQRDEFEETGRRRVQPQLAAPIHKLFVGKVAEKINKTRYTTL